jgi:enterochelin esterase-like enzyme
MDWYESERRELREQNQINSLFSLLIIKGFELKWDQFPSKCQQTEWCKAYLNGLTGFFVLFGQAII